MIECALKEREHYKRRIAKLKEQASHKATWDDVLAWVLTLTSADPIKPRDLSLKFDKSPAWGQAMCKRLVEQGFFEHWGKGLYRRPPKRTGEAALRVTTR